MSEIYTEDFYMIERAMARAGFGDAVANLWERWPLYPEIRRAMLVRAWKEYQA